MVCSGRTTLSRSSAAPTIQAPTANREKVSRTRRGWSPLQSSPQATSTAGSPANSAPVKTRDSWLRGRPRSEPMVLKSAVECAPAQPKRLGGLTDVAAVALQRLADQHPLDL